MSEEPAEYALEPVEKPKKRPLTEAALAQRRANAKKQRIYKGAIYQPHLGVGRQDRRRLTTYQNDIETLLPWLKPADLAAVRALASLLLLRDQLIAACSKHGLMTRNKEPRRLVEELRKTNDSCLRYFEALGMTPQARMRLQVGAAQSSSLSQRLADDRSND